MGTAAHDAPYHKGQTGLKSWIFSTDHKRIGVLYLISILVFFLIGGVFALLVRTELFTAGETIVKPEVYNQFYTLHGVIMVFLFIVPGIPATLGNFLLPLMIGAKDVAYPRLNLLSWWVFIIGALISLASLLGPVDTGWTFYTAYSIKTQSHVVPMVFGAFVMGFASVLTGLNFIVTIHKLRCPGMTWSRMPLFGWSLYSSSLIQVLATPIVGITLLMLIMERLFNVGIFDPHLGGDPVLFEQMFWFYSHPVVYIMILPAFGVVSEILPVFSRKPIFGYKAIAYSSVAIAAISFIVWGHHLFVSSESDLVAKVFSFLTFLVAIPTAIKVFNWVATLYGGSIELSSPMLFTLYFLFLFTIGGLTGIPLAALTSDVYYHDTYYVVAHFHYTMQGGMVIALFAGLHFWWPKITGRMVNESAARLISVFIFIGFNLTFIPQFFLGTLGMPRRYYDYSALAHLPEQFETLHQISTVGAFILGLGYFSSLVNLIISAKKGEKAVANPFDSRSLEWATASPPIQHNFEEIPEISDWTYNYGAKYDKGDQ